MNIAYFLVNTFLCQFKLEKYVIIIFAAWIFTL